MKAIKYITAVTMVLLMGAAVTQAQSTRRASVHDNEKRVAETRQTSREPEKKQAVRPVNNQASRQVQRNQDQPAQKAQPEQHIQKKTPISISTNDNPRSTYRKPDFKVLETPERKADTKVNAYSSKRYYTGNHYHNVYPAHKVNVHYHYDTYLNHYHVLYYPTYVNIYWTRDMYRDYSRWYPNYHWRYNYGYRIRTISVFDAKYNLGEVAMVYGRVYATWYNPETDDFLLFFGGEYPYHEFTVVLPAQIARKFSWKPETYFLGEHITVTGLITTLDGTPEIVVKNKRQLGLY
jgi:hypothetical protein